MLCFSLVIEVLSFGDSEWSSGRWNIECQVEKLEHFRHIFLFSFNRGVKAAEAAINNCAVYGDNAIGESTARKNHFLVLWRIVLTLVTLPRSGRLSRFDNNRLNTLIHNHPRQCTRELANVMNCNHSTIMRHLHLMGKIKKSDGHMCISACS